ncbi:hypothetical protein [Halarchaeum sp. P4]|uniref:hypothetical protein n=1 Tax=Halarchaeum sp. P4 TaxID=3421639 RepID=UPI003EC085E2
MLSLSVLDRLTARLRDPFDAYEIRWTVDGPRAVLEPRLDDAFERVPGDESAAWRDDHPFIYTDHLSFTDDGEIRVVRRWPASVRLALLSILLLAPLITASIWSVPLYLGVAALVQGSPNTDPPIFKQRGNPGL